MKYDFNPCVSHLITRSTEREKLSCTTSSVAATYLVTRGFIPGRGANMKERVPSGTEHHRVSAISIVPTALYTLDTYLLPVINSAATI